MKNSFWKRVAISLVISGRQLQKRVKERASGQPGLIICIKEPICVRSGGQARVQAEDGESDRHGVQSAIKVGKRGYESAVVTYSRKKQNYVRRY